MLLCKFFFVLILKKIFLTTKFHEVFCFLSRLMYGRTRVCALILFWANTIFRANKKSFSYTKKSFSYTKKSSSYTKKSSSYTKKSFSYTKKSSSYTKKSFSYTKKSFSYTKKSFSYTKKLLSYMKEPCIEAIISGKEKVILFKFPIYFI
jgi:hypothetical protein